MEAKKKVSVSGFVLIMGIYSKTPPVIHLSHTHFHHIFMHPHFYFFMYKHSRRLSHTTSQTSSPLTRCRHCLSYQWEYLPSASSTTSSIHHHNISNNNHNHHKHKHKHQKYSKKCEEQTGPRASTRTRAGTRTRAT